jgi:hypothetical protein
MSRDILAIGCAAGFGGDRTDAAAPIVETLIARGGAGALIFETLAERTLALAQLDRRKNPDGGYAPLLEAMARPVLRRFVSRLSALSIKEAVYQGMLDPLPRALLRRNAARGMNSWFGFRGGVPQLGCAIKAPRRQQFPVGREGH